MHTNLKSRNFENGVKSSGAGSVYNTCSGLLRTGLARRSCAVWLSGTGCLRPTHWPAKVRFPLCDSCYLRGSRPRPPTREAGLCCTSALIVMIPWSSRSPLPSVAALTPKRATAQHHWTSLETSHPGAHWLCWNVQRPCRNTQWRARKASANPWRKHDPHQCPLQSQGARCPGVLQ